MPLYEYKCESCGKTFEIIQKFSDTPLEVHDECGGKVIRLVSPSALQFKGSGWYVNDYARSGNGQGKGNKDGKDSKERDEGEVTAATPVVNEMVNMGILTLTKLSTMTTRISTTMKMPAAQKTGRMR